MKHEKGNSLIEVIVALALLGTISVLFLGGVVNSSNARVTADGRASAKILAESIIDSVKKMPYDTSYNVTIPAEFSTYSANLTVASMSNGNIQKLTVVISHLHKAVLTLEDYKVNR
jgi:prepilin-type N-terminal cleavage/methylation domain-containing protein